MRYSWKGRVGVREGEEAKQGGAGSLFSFSVRLSG